MNALAERLRRDRAAQLALVVIGLYALLSLLALLQLLPGDPEVRVGARFLSPGEGHWLGTDRQGRDILVRTLHGAEVAFTIGLVSAALGVFFGALLGGAAGFLGGAIDHLVVWLYSTIESIPSILLLVAVTYLAGRGLFGVYLAFLCTFWVGPCRAIRAEVLRLRDADHVRAARGLGLSPGRILFLHVLPQTAHLMLVQFTLLFVGAVKSEVILSYLGLGVQGGASWGTMINQARAELINGFGWQIGAASVALFGLVLAFNVVAAAFEDALQGAPR